MFDIGFVELLLVLVIALLVLGPERLPQAARKAGQWVGKARAMFNHLRYELEREAHNQDIMAKFDQQIKEMGLDKASLTGEQPDEHHSQTTDSEPAPDHSLTDKTASAEDSTSSPTTDTPDRSRS